jgi:hypothetical protein
MADRAAVEATGSWEPSDAMLDSLADLLLALARRGQRPSNEKTAPGTATPGAASAEVPNRKGGPYGPQAYCRTPRH